jgi:hypothetical protein
MDGGLRGRSALSLEEAIAQALGEDRRAGERAGSK